MKQTQQRQKEQTEEHAENQAEQEKQNGIPQTSKAKHFVAAYKTDVGMQKEQNEDNVYVSVTDNGEAGLFIVADGMGGYQAGEVASRIAVEKICDALKHVFVPVYDQPTFRLTSISEQETILLGRVLPEDDDPTIQLNQARSRYARRTRKPQDSTKAMTDLLKDAIRKASNPDLWRRAKWRARPWMYLDNGPGTERRGTYCEYRR